MIATRTFIVRFSQADRTVVLENSLTRERVRLRDISEIGDQIERWTAERTRSDPAPDDPSASSSP